MGGTDVTSDHIIAELLDMGFEFAKVLNALEAVGPCLNDAVEFILNNSCNNITTYGRSKRSTCSKDQNSLSGKGTNSSNSLCRMKQSNITDHIPSISRVKKDISASTSKPSFSGIKRAKSRPLDEETPANVDGQHLQKVEPESSQMVSHFHIIPKDSDKQLQKNKNFQAEQLPQLNDTDGQGFELDWEQRASDVLQKQFGFSSLKGFQIEAVKAWLAHKDSLILAATGSGKSLCFQIPALLSEKVVVVISPLISLMHDQCLKLAKYGISACFLGSGQPDSTVEQKAMDGVYKIVYVCPETVLRLVEPLMRLAENHRIALFAIDEVHCISKWGHNFRPDYRRLSVLRENFSTSVIKSLRFDIPLMALTATATVPVREDIIKSLHMSKETQIVLTSFFRPNLRFSVKHSRTSCVSSYEKDFRDLVHVYTSSWMNDNKEKNFNDGDNKFNCSSRSDVSSDEDGTSELDNYCNDNDSCANLADEGYASTREGQLTVEYLEDELDTPHSVDDFDDRFTEFLEKGSPKGMELCESIEVLDPLEPLGGGPTIIYVPTRKETTKLAEYFCRSGVRAAAYHAKLPKAQLRHTHGEFQQNLIQVVVATIAFGMGIDKSNVRRIIHYGWPQSLDAYYQEAGRAGRDGKLSDCTLYADFLKVPTLLPSQRSEEQTRQAYKMLSDSFRYGMNTATCRAKTLVKYFGEEFNYDGCGLCDICTTGPPQKQNLTDEVNMFLHVLKAQCSYLGEISSGFVSHDGVIYGESSRKNLLEGPPNFRDVIAKIREQNPKFVIIDRTWWRGLSRILEDMRFIKEADGQVHVSIRNPQITKLGMEFLNVSAEDSLYAYPYADMLLSSQNPKVYSSFSEWGRGWADPEIRRQRLRGRKHRSRRTRKSRRKRQDLSTVRGRLAAKISKLKR